MTTLSSPSKLPEPEITPEPVPRLRLGDRLVAAGLLSARDLERALTAQREMGGLLGQVLIRLGLVGEAELGRVLAEQFGVRLFSLDDAPPVLPEVPGLSPDYLRLHRVCPLQLGEDTLQVAMARPDDAFLLKALALASGRRVEPCLALDADIEKLLSTPLETSDEPLASDASDFVEHLRDLASEAPVIRLVNQIIGRVTDLRASDIHLEPLEAGLQVRYRVDGEISTFDVLSSQWSAAVCSRVKLMAHLDIAERRLPQDGRIRTRVKGRELDLRVSSVPTVHGESLVLRVLDRSSVRFSLADMGFEADTLARFEGLLARPHGIVLVTGPTGSGKTTTLYAALSKIDAESVKIITVEEPVEYQLPGINQIQVHSQIGLSFARALRSIRRQDPDIIMIGEMRDGETAQIAVQSALTGHLVLSTLHTNTAAGAVTRLRDMGVEPYLITSTVNGVLSQRLVRRLCPHCKAPDDVSEAVRTRTGLGRFLAAGAPVWRAVGCPQCRDTGYQGRTGLHELLVIDDALRRLILDGADSTRLHQQAIANGMIGLFDDGLRKVAAGITSLDEVMRMTEDQTDA